VALAAPLLGLLVSNCSFEGRYSNVQYGDGVPDDAVFCEVEKRDVAPGCATAVEVSMGRYRTQGALDLVLGQRSPLVLDGGQEQLEACGGQPLVTTYESAAPDGEAICLDGDTAFLAPTQPSVAAVCFNRCLDIHRVDPDDIPDDMREFCGQHARPAVNMPLVAGSAFTFAGACSDGKLRADFADPRKRPTPVAWTNLSGVEVVPPGNTLRRTAPDSPEAEGFNAGATATQIVTHGDAYVEFTATELGQAKLLGFSQGRLDGDATKDDVDFGIRLGAAGAVLLSEYGNLVYRVPPTPEDPDGDVVFGAYVAGSRFRIRLTEQPSGGALVTYEQILGACNPDTTCPAMPLRSPSGPVAYPFRIDTSLKEMGAALTDVRVVYLVR
jgi:hypothetical protein